MAIPLPAVTAQKDACRRVLSRDRKERSMSDARQYRGVKREYCKPRPAIFYDFYRCFTIFTVVS